jgi:linoleoyl-CoA desaturase
MSKVSFPSRGEFNKTLQIRVEQYFAERGISKFGNWRMLLKTAIILTWMVVSYVLLVFFSTSLVMAVITAFAVSQGFVLIGFNIMHDGNHGSYSRSRRINRVMGFTLDLIGGSNLLWRQKHNILHHTYTNIDELDDDLYTSGWLRLSPNQRWRPWHRFQHLYAIPLYSFLTLSWISYSDFKRFFARRIGEYDLPKVSVRDANLFFVTKIFYFGYTIVLPLFFHPLLYVLGAFVVIHLVLGFTLSIVFQLAHSLEGNTFPSPDTATGHIDNEWAIHQVETTANFARQNRIVTWYLGCLNFQIEHHLFPQICHIHYPEISRIVEESCRAFSVLYVNYPTARSAIAAHFRFLTTLGRNPAIIAT